MPDIVALGDANVDIIAHFPAYPARGKDALALSMEFRCGGSAANTARALSCLGLEVVLISRVGTDPLAQRVLDSLRKANIGPAGLQIDPAVATGLMYVIVTPEGERTMLGYRGANVLTDPRQIREEEIQDARLFHLSGYALLTDPQRRAALLALEMACHHGLTVTLDPGMSLPPTALDEVRALLPAVDVLLPNLPEAQQLAGSIVAEECARALVAMGVRTVALKLGKDGCLVGQAGKLVQVPGFDVEARDSTGAGDHFAAGFIAGFLGGLAWQSAAVLANAMGALAATRVGAGTSRPGEVLELLRKGHQQFYRHGYADAIQEAIDFVAELLEEEEPQC